MTKILTLLIAAMACPSYAQTGPIIAGAGYSAPAPVEAAPGQVVTLFVRGLPPASDGRFRSAQATDAQLPNMMAGISVAIVQEQGTLYAPLFAVRQENECPNDGATDPTCLLTSIRVQIPFELAAGIRLSDTGKVLYSSPVQVRVEVDGRSGRPFALQPLPDNAHVLTNCDASWNTDVHGICSRTVYHADGTPADEKTPAKGGETVTVYAFGLGVPSPSVATGVASPSGAIVTDLLEHPRVVATFQKDFLNALSSTPRTFASSPAGGEILPVVFAGLVPGQIGMYQLNVRLPSAVSSFPCGGEVRSNAVLSIATLQGSEVIALCVQP